MWERLRWYYCPDDDFCVESDSVRCEIDRKNRVAFTTYHATRHNISALHTMRKILVETFHGADRARFSGYKRNMYMYMYIVLHVKKVFFIA